MRTCVLFPVVALFAVVGLTGCDWQDVKGHLIVRQSLQFVDVQGHPVTIAAGAYDQAEVSATSDRLRISAGRKKGQRTVAKISLPKNAGLVSLANFTLTAAQLGQPYDAMGASQAVENDSNVRQDIEDCTYKVIENVCQPVGSAQAAQAADSARPASCVDQEVEHAGHQHVSYYIATISTHFKISLVTPGTRESAADFEGDTRREEKRDITREVCH
jgi:hypothetical protein